MAETLDCHRNPYLAAAPKKYTFHSFKHKGTEPLDIAVQDETTFQTFQSSHTASANEPQQGTSDQVNRGQMQEIYIDEDISIMENPVDCDDKQHSDTSSSQGSAETPPDLLICNFCGKHFDLHICP